MSARDPRRLLLDLYQAALRAVDGAESVARALRTKPLSGPVHAVAIGKAGAAMLQGAARALGDDLHASILITRRGHATAAHLPDACMLIEAGHPLPDAQSLAAGESLLGFIAGTPNDATLLFLISGGASSLVEVYPGGVSLDDLIAANTWLLGSALDIRAMNRVRTALSRIKGGQLLHYLQGRSVRALLISDVPGDDPAVIGSGLLVPAAYPPNALDDLDLPDWLRALCHLSLREDAGMDAGDTPVDLAIVACNADAQQAVVDAARNQRLAVHAHIEPLQGDAHALGARLVRELRDAPPGIHVWGGESVVRLPVRSGRGGRNQALALAAAIELRGCDDCWLLAAGTDGSDGPTEDAGALVDGGTLTRGALDDLDAHTCLTAADAGRFLEASGDLIQTGPTGTNVMDLVIALRGDS